MKIREHRGGLAESLATTEEIAPTMAALVDYVSDKMKQWVVTVNAATVKIEKYGNGIDGRCGWDTHIVTIDEYGVFGMTDGPLTETVDR